MSIFYFIENTQSCAPNVDAVLESIVSNHLHPAVKTLRLKTHTASVVQPGFHCLTQKFHPVNGELVHEAQLASLLATQQVSSAAVGESFPSSKML